MARILTSDRAPDRVQIKVSKSIKDKDLPGGVGILAFGQENNYPNLMENLINSSVTGISVYRVLSKFISGSGLENELLNKKVVGRDINGLPLTVKDLISDIADQIAKFNGVYLHVNRNVEGYITRISVLNFPTCRLSKPDDLGFSSKVVTSNDWKRFKKSIHNTYELYQHNNEAWTKNLTDVKQHKGQVYYIFLDRTYRYPLSVFDSVALDMATENETSEFRYNESANSFVGRTIVRVPSPDTEEAGEKIKDKFTGMIGGEGDRIILLTDELDENGEVLESGAFRVDKIESTISDKLFESYETIIPNRIRKAAYALPAVLIDYEESKLGNTSGEAIRQAVEFYNTQTSGLRDRISGILNNLLGNFADEQLRNNKDWAIKELSSGELSEFKETPEEIKSKAQAQLRGSVGGVTALLQIQQSVASGVTSLESGIAIVSEIYGIPDAVAEKMLNG